MQRHNAGATRYNINDLELDYLTTDDTIFSESEEVDKYKHIIKDELTDTEKRLMLLYVHLASQRKVAQLLRVSPATINRLIREIQTKIKDKYLEKQ